MLGSIFDARIDDWSKHVGKIANFWQKVILGVEGYNGSPFQTHHNNPQVKPELFDRWLTLFEESLSHSVPPQAQKEWTALARRIGASFRMQIEKRDAGLLRDVTRHPDADAGQDDLDTVLTGNNS